MAKSFTFNDIALKQAAIVIQKIKQHVDELKWTCLYPDCQNKSVNSHLLQRRGILSHIAENNTLVQFSQTNAFEALKTAERHCFKVKTVNQAMSLPLFCKEHDSNLFKRIEQNIINFDEYESQLLFSFRAVCAEKRRKEIIIEADSRVLKSKILRSSYDEESLKEISVNVESNKLGVSDLNHHINSSVGDLSFGTQSFLFRTFRYKPLKVCASAIFTPFDYDEEYEFYSRETPFSSCIINLIPQEEGLFIIAGYHKEFVSNWIIEYIESLHTTDEKEQEKNVSNLFATRINSFALSKTAYDLIKPDKREAFLNYWGDNYQNLDSNQFYNGNLFE